MITTLLSPSKEAFVERRIGGGEDGTKKPQNMEERVQALQLQVAENTIKLKNQITNHDGLVSSIHNGLSKFSNFFTRLNEDAANSFSTSGLILFNGKNFSNKQKLKDLIMKNISNTYTPVIKDDEEEDEDEDEEDEGNDIQYSIVEVVSFIFVDKRQLFTVTGMDNSNDVISKHLSIVKNEVADYFSLRNNEQLMLIVEEQLQNKSAGYLVDQLMSFRNRYLQKYKNIKNKDRIKFRNFDKFTKEWFLYFPYYRNYKDIENKLKGKFSAFFEFLSELQDDLE
uniref:Uncharacterized protein n=1 Tax=viral metagenome TaxID=1070528 RepID=A0A6C0CTI8_9ZZZZ